MVLALASMGGKSYNRGRMLPGQRVQLTKLLNAWAAGDGSALERLTPVVHAELHRMAQWHMANERAGHILQPSALVNEAFVRLIDGAKTDWGSRTEFFAHAGRLMRHILIDFARAQQTGKRGFRSPHLELSEWIQDSSQTKRFVDLLDLDAALQELAGLSMRQAQVVELRYFAGLGIPDTARALKVSEATVIRDWGAARAWLFQRLQPGAIE